MRGSNSADIDSELDSIHAAKNEVTIESIRTYAEQNVDSAFHQMLFRDRTEAELADAQRETLIRRAIYQWKPTRIERRRPAHLPQILTTRRRTQIPWVDGSPIEFLDRARRNTRSAKGTVLAAQMAVEKLSELDPARLIVVVASDTYHEIVESLSVVLTQLDELDHLIEEDDAA